MQKEKKEEKFRADLFSIVGLIERVESDVITSPPTLSWLAALLKQDTKKEEKEKIKSKIKTLGEQQTDSGRSSNNLAFCLFF